MRWLALLHLYPEHSTFRQVDIPLHYLKGLGVNAHYLQEELFALRVIKTNDLRLYSEHLPANNVPKRLQVFTTNSNHSSNIYLLLTPIVPHMGSLYLLMLTWFQSLLLTLHTHWNVLFKATLIPLLMTTIPFMRS